MLITGHPQFSTQNDAGIGDGIPPVPEWQLDPSALHDDLDLGSDYIEYEVKNVLVRLRNAFQRAQQIPFPTTQLHDLTCFVVHRLLLSASDTTNIEPLSPFTECIRYAIILYMFIIQGPTYYSHAVIFNTIVAQFMEHLKKLQSTPHVSESIDVWLLAIGMVASTGTSHYQWFTKKAQGVASSLQLGNWSDILIHIKRVLWLETLQSECIFRPHWDAIISPSSQPGPSDFSILGSQDNIGAGFLQNTISPANLIISSPEFAGTMEGNGT